MTGTHKTTPQVLDLAGWLFLVRAQFNTYLSITAYETPNLVSHRHKAEEGTIQGSAVAPHSGRVFFQPWV